MNDENLNTNNELAETPADSNQPKSTKKRFGFSKPKLGASKLALNMRALIGLFLLLLLAFALYAAKGFFVSAVVNGKPISRFKIVGELERRNGQQVLEGIVNQTLLEQEAKKRGVTVSEDEINEDIKKIDDNMKAQGSSLDDALAMQNISQAEFRVLLKTNKVLEKLIADKVAVTDEEVKTYFEQNKATFPADSTLETVKEQIVPFLQQQKVDVESQKLFTELREKGKLYFWKKY